MNIAPLNLVELVGEDDRNLLIAALQALWRERVAARNAVRGIAQLNRQVSTIVHLTAGVEEVESMLRRVSSAPIR